MDNIFNEMPTYYINKYKQNISEPLQLMIDESEQNVDMGETATITCTTSQAVNVTWYNNGIALHPSTSHVFTESSTTSSNYSYSLSVVNVTREHRGVYQCEAMNKYRSSVRQMLLQLGSMSIRV